MYDRGVLIRGTDSPSEIALVPYEQAYEVVFEDMSCRVSDISRIQCLIGYRPVLDLKGNAGAVIADECGRAR
jgi:UDP-glucose 4-epimerase